MFERKQESSHLCSLAWIALVISHMKEASHCTWRSSILSLFFRVLLCFWSFHWKLLALFGKVRRHKIREILAEAFRVELILLIECIIFLSACSVPSWHGIISVCLIFERLLRYAGFACFRLASRFWFGSGCCRFTLCHCRRAASLQGFKC